MSLAALDARFPARRAAITGAAKGSPICETAALDTTDEGAVTAAIDAFAGRAGGVDYALNVASAAGFACAGRMSAYNASKAAVIALSETLFQELAEHRVAVAVAMPGFFRTRLLEHARAHADAMGFARKLMRRSNLEADAVAREILGRAAKGETHIMLPGAYRWLWRMKRLAPRFFVNRFTALRRRGLSRGG